MDTSLKTNLDQNWEKNDRRILVLAILAIVIFSYLLWDDSIFNSFRIRTGTQIGVITWQKNDVRAREGRKLVWIHSQVSQPIFAGDSIFTGEKSGAIVQFKDGTKIELDQNTLIVFDVRGEIPMLNLRTGSVKGELNGKLAVGDWNSTLCGENSSFTLTSQSHDSLEIKNAQGGVFTDCENQKKNLAKVVIIKKVRAQKSPENQLKFESPVPVSPILLSPATGEVLKLHPQETGEWSYMGTPTIHIDAPSGESQFELQFSEDKDFTTMTQSVTSAEPAVRVPKLAPGKYFLRVKSQGENRVDSKWSGSVVFFVEREAEARLPANVLTAPVLAQNEISWNLSQKNSVDLRWKPVMGADQYQVEVFLESDPEKPMMTTQTRQTKLNFQKSLGAKLFYRIKALDLQGNSGPWSENGEISMTTDLPRAMAVQNIIDVKQDDNDQGRPKQINLQWSSVTNAFGFRTVLEKADGSRAPETKFSRFPASTFTIPEPGLYKWKVQVIARDGSALTEFQDMGQFRYQLRPPLKTPKILEPWSNSTLFFQTHQSTPVWLSWGEVSDARTYRIEVARDVDFKLKVREQEVQKNNLFMPGPFKSGTFYWRVRALREQKKSAWSTPIPFVVWSGPSKRQIYR